MIFKFSTISKADDISLIMTSRIEYIMYIRLTHGPGKDLLVWDRLVKSSIELLKLLSYSRYYKSDDYLSGFLQDWDRSQLYYCDPILQHISICHHFCLLLVFDVWQSWIFCLIWVFIFLILTFQSWTLRLRLLSLLWPFMCSMVMYKTSPTRTTTPPYNFSVISKLQHIMIIIIYQVISSS